MLLRCRLEEALWADTAFLAALGVMDYSLLVGIDRDASQLVVGIIDFVRQVPPASSCLLASEMHKCGKDS